MRNVINYREGGGGGFGGGGRGRSFGGGGRSFGGRDRPRPEMHDATCDKCKKECQVPFRPSGDKPVLCSDCFRNGGSGSRGRGGSSGMSSEQFTKINTKLDKIIKLLGNSEVESKEDLDKDLLESLDEDEEVSENKSETESEDDNEAESEDDSETASESK